MIRKIIENHFENELFLEKIKSKILGNLSFNIEKVFDFLDYDNDGFLSMHDVFFFKKNI